MKKLLIALAAVLVTVATHAQGTLAFNTRVVGSHDAPVTLRTADGEGAGPAYSAQLYVVGAGGAFTPIPGITTFRAVPDGGNPLLARYVNPIDVTATGVAAGSQGQIVLRAWLTSAGSFDAAPEAQRGQSAPTTVAFGGETPGGVLAPGNLTGLTGFIIPVPEPSTIALGALGAAALLFRRRK